MNNILLLFITLIFSSFLISFSNTQSLDYDCFYNLAKESQSLDGFYTGSEYYFCKPNLVVCSGEVITSIYFQFPINNASFILRPSHINCFKNLNILSLFNTKISSDFIYQKYNNLSSLSMNGTDDITINNIIPLIDTFSIDGPNRKVQNLNLNYFINVKNLFISSLVPNFINDNQPIQGTLESINLNIISYPNLTNFKSISKAALTLGPNFDSASTNNIYSFLNVVQLSITSIVCTPFPIELCNLNSNKLIQLSFDGCIPNPTQLFNLSNVSSLDAFKLSFTNFGSFCFGGECAFPFSYLQKMLQFTMTGGSVYIFNDQNIFENVSVVSLENNKIKSSLGTKEKLNPRNLYLNNNNIVGSLDSSWCSTEMIVENNNMTGNIPSCFKCYFTDPIFKYRFSGNQFTNFDSSEPCTTIIPSTLYISPSGVIYINGTDLILSSSQIKSTPSLGWSVYTPSKLFGAPSTNETKSLNTIDILILDTYKFTMSLISQAPIISNITFNSSNTVIIQGSYFTYDKSFVDIEVGDATCLIQSTTFNQIVCGFPETNIFPAINQTASLTIIGYPMIKLYLSTGVSFVNQMCKPTCNQDVTCNMISATCSCSGQCLNGGQCNLSSNQCECSSPFFGKNCEQIQCSSECNQPNGKCDTSTGVCSCSIYWTGVDCNTTNHYVTSISSTTTNGGLVELYGHFGDVHSYPSVMIGGLNCIITEINNNDIVCNLPSTTSENSGTFKNVIVVQNLVEWKGTNYFKYTENSKLCPRNCIDSNHGTCNSKTGVCECQPKWTGLDCAVELNNEHPKSNTTIDESTGGTNINNQNTNYQILISSINELDFNDQIVKTIPLEGKWVFLNSSKNANQDGNTITYFSQQFNQTKIISTIEEVSKSKQYSFAGVDFQVESGSLKFTISIQNWQYESILNSLRLEMKSTVDQYNPNCQENTTISINGDEQASNLNFMTISKGDKIMYGRFIEKALSDSRPTFIKTQVISQDKDSLIIGLNLPHCTNECIVDPDFSVLVQSDFQSKCGSSSSRPKWLIPVAVVVPVVGLSLLIIIVYVLYTKNRTLVKIHISSFKLSKMKKNGN